MVKEKHAKHTKPNRNETTQHNFFLFEMNRLERSIQALYCMNEGEVYEYVTISDDQTQSEWQSNLLCPFSL